MSTKPTLTSCFLLFFLCLLNLSSLLAQPQTTNNNILYSDEQLEHGVDYLEHDKYRFMVQNDCNVVLNESNKPKWTSNTTGKGKDCYLLLQADGNLVLNDRNDKMVWSAGIKGSGFGKYVLVLQKDGVVNVYGGPLWSTDAPKVVLPNSSAETS